MLSLFHFHFSLLMKFSFQAEEDFFSTVVYTELAPLETAMIVSQVWQENPKVLLFKRISLTWSCCSTTWRQKVLASVQQLGWPPSKSETLRNEQVRCTDQLLVFLAILNIRSIFTTKMKKEMFSQELVNRCQASCGRQLWSFPKKLNQFQFQCRSALQQSWWSWWHW